LIEYKSKFQSHIPKEVKDFYFLFDRIIMGTEDINLPHCLMLLILSNQFITLLQSRVIIHSLQFHITLEFNEVLRRTSKIWETELQ